MLALGLAGMVLLPVPSFTVAVFGGLHPVLVPRLR